VDGELGGGGYGYARKLWANPSASWAAQQAYASALRVATNPSTRTAPAVQTKNDARKTLIELSRQLVGIVQVYPGTTDEMRTALGLTIRKKRVREVAAPPEAPSLRVGAMIGERVTLHISKREGDGHARPTGAKGYTWFYFAGDTYPETLAGWSFGGNGIDPKVDASLPGVEPGSQVWFTANWFNNRMQPGPASHPIVTRIAGGGITSSNQLGLAA